MRKVIALVSMLVVGCLAASAGAGITWPAGRPLHVLFVGDSITFGIRATTKAQAFPQLVTAALEAKGNVVAKVAGKGGAGAHYWQPHPLPKGQDVVVLEIGTNDIGPFGTPHPGPDHWFQLGYSSLIAKLQKDSPHARFYCVGAWRPDAPVPAAKYDVAIRKMCPGVFVSVERQAKVAANVSTVDGLHPTDAGHAAIARAILSAMGV